MFLLASYNLSYWFLSCIIDYCLLKIRLEMWQVWVWHKCRSRQIWFFEWLGTNIDSEKQLYDVAFNNTIVWIVLFNIIDYSFNFSIGASKSRTKSLVSSVPFLEPTAHTSFVGLARILHTTPPLPPLCNATKSRIKSPENVNFCNRPISLR